MSDDVPDPQSVDARLASLAQFGFPENAWPNSSPNMKAAPGSDSNGSNSGVKRLLAG